MRGVVVTYACVRDIDENSFRFSCKSRNCLRKLFEKAYLEFERNDGSNLKIAATVVWRLRSNLNGYVIIEKEHEIAADAGR